jgi:hypothetical protein
MKYIILFIVTLLFTNCTKEKTTQVTETPKPVLIRVEAEHIDGEVIYSPIVLVR